MANPSKKTVKATGKGASKPKKAAVEAIPAPMKQPVSVSVESADNGYVVSAWIKDRRRVLIAKDKAEAARHIETLMNASK